MVGGKIGVASGSPIVHETEDHFLNYAKSNYCHFLNCDTKSLFSIHIIYYRYIRFIHKYRVK